MDRLFDNFGRRHGWLKFLVAALVAVACLFATEADAKRKDRKVYVPKAHCGEVKKKIGRKFKVVCVASTKRFTVAKASVKKKPSALVMVTSKPAAAPPPSLVPSPPPVFFTPQVDADYFHFDDGLTPYAHVEVARIEPQNIFQRFLTTLLVPAHAAVKMQCPDGRGGWKPMPTPLVRVATRAANHFGKSVRVMSAYRSLSHNARVGGARRSQHVACKALDFYVPGVYAQQLHAWALQQPELGGVGRYKGNFIHIDVRPRVAGKIVTWDWRGTKRWKPKTRYASRHRHG